jgi:hypothetical protein
MSDNDRDLDILLRRNAERQLAGFDWEQFGRGVGRRLTDARASTRSWHRDGRWVALAATIALTAGVLLWAAICATRPGGEEPAAGQATVAMVETAHVMGTAQVSCPPIDKPVRGEVTILTTDRPREDRARASWCIIAQQDLPSEKHWHGDDASDTLCLF